MEANQRALGEHHVTKATKQSPFCGIEDGRKPVVQSRQDRLRVPALAFGVALLPRLLLILFTPATEGDGDVYGLVAENILRNGCVSMSDPTTAACIPHWGGNQPPGYPLMIALAWGLSGHAPIAPLVLQSLLM